MREAKYQRAEPGFSDIHVGCPFAQCNAVTEMQHPHPVIARRDVAWQRKACPEQHILLRGNRGWQHLPQPVCLHVAPQIVPLFRIARDGRAG